MVGEKNAPFKILSGQLCSLWNEWTSFNFFQTEKLKLFKFFH